MTQESNSKFSSQRRSKLIPLFRMTPVFLGFVFSLAYSNLMGIENRSFLTFVLLVNTLLTFLLLAGLSMRIRNSGSSQEVKDLVPAYLIFSFLISFIIAGILISILILSVPHLSFISSSSLPKNVLISVAIYSFLSALSLPLSDLLSLFESLKAFLIIEVLLVLSQILVFVLLVTLGQTSFFVSALLAYALSYAFLFFSTITLVVSNNYFSTKIRNSFGILVDSQLLRYYLQGFVLLLVERIDKVLVPFFYSSPQLAQVSVFSGILNFSRVVPDTDIRITQRKLIAERGIIKPVGASHTIRNVVIVGLTALLGNLVIYVALGKEWVLPFPVIILLTTYEVLVWKAKALLSSAGDHSRKAPTLLNVSIGFFYLLPLPILMFQFGYLSVLLILVLVVSLWLYIHSYRHNCHTS